MKEKDDSKRTAGTPERQSDSRESNPGRTPGQAEGDPETVREALQNEEKKHRREQNH